MAEPLQEEEELAASILGRLESSESLSGILPAARRLAEMLNDGVEADWLLLESVGIEVVPAADRPFPEAWSEALEKFIRLHAVIDAMAGAGAPALMPSGRTKVASRSIMELERMSKPFDPLAGNVGLPTTHSIDTWQRATLIYLEAQRVVHRVRQEVHGYVTRARKRARQLRNWLTLFGRDAPAVFAAGGPLLDELRNAAASLREPGKAATAAIEARTALLTMGRELYKGPDQHTSPITGETFAAKMEINKLQAYLDQLWERAPEDRKPLLVAAHDEVDTAYELGSRAKNPFALTTEQAEHAVRSTFAVAHAITFAGGFPPPTPSASQ